MSDTQDGSITESDCPWCADRLHQGMEVRYCESCPFSAQYPADLSDAPPYIIRVFAEHAEEKWREIA